MRRVRHFVLALASLACASKPAEPPRAVIVPQAEAEQPAAESDSAQATDRSPPQRRSGGLTERLRACNANPSQGALEDARRQFRVAVEHFKNGELDTAARIFADLYEQTCATAVLFNLGTALRQAKRNSEAIAVFELYLEREPQGARADEVRQQIEQLGAGR